MIGTCPHCERETKLEPIRGSEVVQVRGESVEVEAEYLRCKECGEDFESTEGPDSLDAAYRKFRQIRNMLQPETIRDWRKQHGLTQKEIASLLGWGDVTLSRYETGALQT